MTEVRRMTGSRRKFRDYLLWYTVAFAALFFVCCGVYFILYHRAPIWSFDTLAEHFQGFIYEGKLLRQWVRNIIHEHNFEFPLWGSSISYGADIPMTIGGYLFDPFFLLSALFPPEKAEIGYSIMVFVKMYVAGLSFVVLVWHRRAELYAAIAGAAIYVFSNTTYIGFYHPTFLTPLIVLPLLIVGVDELYEKGRPLVYVLVLAFSLTVSLFFSYIIGILVFLHCVLRRIISDRGEKPKGYTLKLVLRFALYSVIAACLCGVFLLPNLNAFLGMDRLNLKPVVPMFYKKFENGETFTGFLTGVNMQSRDAMMGFGAVGLACLFALFTLRGKHARLKAEAAMMAVGLFIPFVGHMMNGFSYTSNRWVFGFILLVAYVVTVVLPELPKLTAAQKAVFAGLAVAYVAVARFVFNAVETDFVVLACLFAVVPLLYWVLPKIPVRIYRAGIVFMTCLSVAAFSFFTFSKDYTNLLETFMFQGASYPTTRNNGGLRLVKHVKKKDNERFDTLSLLVIRNSSWSFGMSTFDFYNSMYNSDITRFHDELGVRTDPMPHSYSGMNIRSELEVLLGTNHFFTYAYNPRPPYGFDKLELKHEVHGEMMHSYTTEKENSTFYFIDKSVSRADYEPLGPLEKQQLLMQAVVLDEGNATMDDIVIDDDEQPYLQAGAWNLTYDGEHLITATEEGAKLALSFEQPVDDAEIYVFFDDIYFRQEGEVRYNVDADYRIFLNAMHEGREIDWMNTNYWGNNDQTHLYGDKHDWLIDLGYADETVDGIVLTFSKKGEYEFDGIRLYIRPKAELDASMARLDGDGMDFSYGVNRMTGSFTAEKDGYLFASIPWSRGWSATLDGEKAQILKADTAFMAVPVSAGEHTVVFRYRTPGILPGLGLSCATLLGCAAAMLLRRRKRARVPAK